jgi:hypothetical protein
MCDLKLSQLLIIMNYFRAVSHVSWLTVWHDLSSYHGICLGSLRQATKNFIQEVWETLYSVSSPLDQTVLMLMLWKWIFTGSHKTTRASFIVRPRQRECFVPDIRCCGAEMKYLRHITAMKILRHYITPEWPESEGNCIQLNFHF